MAFVLQKKKTWASVAAKTAGESEIGGSWTSCWEVGDVWVGQSWKLQRKFGTKWDMNVAQNTMILFHVSCTTLGWHTQKNADLAYSELWMCLDSSFTRYGRCSFFLGLLCGVGLLIPFNYHNTMASLPSPPGRSYLCAKPLDWVLNSKCLPNPPKWYSVTSNTWSHRWQTWCFGSSITMLKLSTSQQDSGVMATIWLWSCFSWNRDPSWIPY
jgi:hypothetical protein